VHKQKVNEIFRRFFEKNPDPKIELEYYSAYTLSVAVILSAQSTDKGVNRATPSLFRVADTPDKMIELGEEKLKGFIKTIGLYNSKARHIISLSKMLIERYGGELPASFDQLKELPGVGRKSANVLLNTLWNKPTIAGDTHVFRVSNRIGFCNAKNPIQTESALKKIVPTEWKKKAHHWLVLHGRYVCKARKPDCSRCIIEDVCKYNADNI
jgi:endonuclease III